MTAAAVAALCGGHLLIEDVPGVGKTVLARALAASLGAELSRVQGHPDLLPSDITGVSVFAPDTGSWEFRPGSGLRPRGPGRRAEPHAAAHPVCALGDDGGASGHASTANPGRCRDPHLVIATQNPRSQLGTFPLVESQLDRFAVATSIGYPDAEQEAELVLHAGGKYALAELQAVCTPEEWRRAQRAIESVPVERSVADYAVEICRASRGAPGVYLGASPRASIWLVRAAQAHAVLAARDFVVPDDVKAMSPSRAWLTGSSPRRRTMAWSGRQPWSERSSRPRPLRVRERLAPARPPAGAHRSGRWPSSASGGSSPTTVAPAGCSSWATSSSDAASSVWSGRRCLGRARVSVRQAPRRRRRPACRWNCTSSPRSRRARAAQSTRRVRRPSSGRSGPARRQRATPLTIVPPRRGVYRK